MRIFIFIVFCIAGNSCFAEADGPDEWQVSGISSGKNLNMRKGPSRDFPVIAKLPGNATNLENLGCFPEFSPIEWQDFNARERQLASKLRWCRVGFKGMKGWVYGQYLQEY